MTTTANEPGGNGAPNAKPETSPTSGLGYLPGLDGIRAFALMPVLLFHAGFAWVPGAMFGLSTFFTMSGYLITSLLIEEHKGTGGIGLKEFWRRRFRRLLPASLVAMVLAIAFGLFAADATQRAELGGDIAASLAYVANWWFIGTGQSYTDLFGAPSPLLHIWSLAVEEQFYLVLPLVAWAFLRRRGGDVPLNRRLVGFGWVIGVALVFTTALPFLFTISDDFFYYATPTRLPEMLTGVLLAMVFAPGARRRKLSDPALAPLATVAGAGAVAVMVWLWATVSLETAWVYRGGFAAFSLVSVVLILAMHNGRSPLTKVMTVPPMLHLGRISYGVYLFHWPIFLWITPQRTGLDGWPLFGVRMAVVLALAEASFRLVETPIRRTGRLKVAGAWRPLGRFAPVAIAALVFGGVLTSATAPEPALDLARSQSEQVDFNEEVATAPTAPVVDTDNVDTSDVDVIEALLPIEPPPVRISVFGDSTAMMSTVGIGIWASGQTNASYGPGATMIGCGIQRTGDKFFSAQRIEPLNEWCGRWPVYWEQRVRASQPNTAFVQVGPWDLINRRQSASDPFIGPGDPGWEEWVLDDMLTAVDMFTDNGVFVVWATAPRANAALFQPQTVGADRFFGDVENLADDRFAIYNNLVASLPELRPGAVEVLDLAGWHDAVGDRDFQLRPDGIHVTDDASIDIAAELIGPELARMFDASWADGFARRLAAQTIASWAEVPPLQDWDPSGPLRVVVWSHDRADAVADALTAVAGDGSNPAIDVVVVSQTGCGVTESALRRTPAGIEDNDPACGGRDAVRAAIASHQPHLVFVAPGEFELSDQMPFSTGTLWLYPGEPFSELWLIDELGLMIDEIRAAGAQVGLVSLDPGAAVGLPYADGARRVDVVNNVLRRISESPGRLGWLTLVDVRGGQPLDTAVADVVERTVTNVGGNGE